MKKNEISTAAHAAHIATFQAIKHGKVGIGFTCPDTCSIEWTDEAIAHVVQSVWAVDSENVFKQWIEDLLYEAGAPPEKLLKVHPDYDRKLAEFNSEMADEEREYRAEQYRDDCERVRDMRGAQ